LFVLEVIVKWGEWGGINSRKWLRENERGLKIVYSTPKVSGINVAEGET